MGKQAAACIEQELIALPWKAAQGSRSYGNDNSNM